MINVIVADDHPVMLEGINNTLKSEPNIQVLTTATSGAEMLFHLKTKHPDIVILDISMQDMTGLEVAKIIQQEHKEIKILFLSQFDDKWLIKKSIEVGGKAYLIKNISKKELVKAINLVNEGGLNFFYKYGE